MRTTIANKYLLTYYVSDAQIKFIFEVHSIIHDIDILADNTAIIVDAGKVIIL